MAYDILHDQSGQTELRGLMGSLPRVSDRMYPLFMNYPSSSLGGATMTANQIVYFWFYVPTATTFTGIGIEVVSTGGSGSLALASYQVDNTGTPTTLKELYGTLSLASTGVQELEINSSFTSGGMYSIAAVANNATPTVRLWNAPARVNSSWGIGSSVPGNNYTCFTETTSGMTFPSTATPTIARRFVNTAPAIFLKV